MNHRIGLHIRIHDSLVDAAKKAHQLQLSFFQCFLVGQDNGTVLSVSPEEKKIFLSMRRKYFDTLFCHGSYWINLASLGNNGYSSLCREVKLAKQLEFTHFLLHCGSAKGAHNKSQGIDALAICLNSIIKKEENITFVLENTSHGNLSVGSDLLDFKYLLEKIDKPERIGFCIDTAHAYAFGYDISHEYTQDDFITLLDAIIGIERIKLIHLNDSAERFGSKIDRHAVLGEGKIGFEMLARFAYHPQLVDIPLLLELPAITLENERDILNRIIQ